MTLKGHRTIKNMLIIGGTISTIAFGFSMISSKSSISRIAGLGYSSDRWIPNITNISSIDNIEDFEYQKGCKFLFYKKNDKGKAFTQGKIDDARNFIANNQNTKDEKIIQKVNELKEKCVKSGFVYIEMDN